MYFQVFQSRDHRKLESNVTTMEMAQLMFAIGPPFRVNMPCISFATMMIFLIHRSWLGSNHRPISTPTRFNYSSFIGRIERERFCLLYKAYGPGLETTGQIIGKPTEFTVDTHSAGDAPLRVQAIDQEYEPVDVQVRNNGNGTYTCRYTPRHPIRHCILIDYGGVAVPHSPFRVRTIAARVLPTSTTRSV